MATFESKKKDDVGAKIDELFSKDKIPPELRVVDENIRFEKDVLEQPVPEGVGGVDVFGTTWDINGILKGNYWRRSIYTTDKLCKLFLKADLNQKKKYLARKNPQGFNFFWIMIIMFGVVIAILVLFFLLPQMGVM